MSKSYYRRLIEGLEQLYTKVSLIVLHNRVSSYHARPAEIKRKHPDGIKTPLSQFIETTVAQATSSEHTNQSYQHLAEERKPRQKSDSATPLQYTSLSRERIDELSKYFKQRNKGGDLHPPIKEQLEHSVWEHIHATIRCAKQGDKNNARMHLNIAHSACKELGHYMDEEEYQAFVKKAEDHMETLTTPK
ncbi:MAG: hypothetical protein OEZ15_03170 [Gammaproteobacteria bacterium]|nr:hypothetical protein [Gammaproteobacteria bacterium]